MRGGLAYIYIYTHMHAGMHACMQVSKLCLYVGCMSPVQEHIRSPSAFLEDNLASCDKMGNGGLNGQWPLMFRIGAGMFASSHQESVQSRLCSAECIYQNPHGLDVVAATSRSGQVQFETAVITATRKLDACARHHLLCPMVLSAACRALGLVFLKWTSEEDVARSGSHPPHMVKKHAHQVLQVAVDSLKRQRATCSGENLQSK